MTNLTHIEPERQELYKKRCWARSYYGTRNDQYCEAIDDLQRAREWGRILDAILENHGAFISHRLAGKYQCMCDPSVGYTCDGCEENSLLRALARAAKGAE
jgi:hypothetical protein